MLDSEVIQIPFSSKWVASCASEFELNSPDPFSRDVVCSIPPEYLPTVKGAKEIYYENGIQMVSDIYCPWESIASSHSGMALKVYHEGNGHCKWPYIELKCSPAKLLQGHNVFGFDDLRKASKNMLYLLNKTYPEFLGGWEVLDHLGPMLDLENARVSEIDITYSLSIKDERTRLSFIEFCRYLSKGHTKNTSNSYDSTVYFGAKNSRLKRLKVYLKGIEIQNDNKNRIKKGLPAIPDDIMKLSENLVRIECTLKKEWLERRGISVKLTELINTFEADADQFKKIFYQATLDFFKGFEGQEMTILDDDKVLAKITQLHSKTRGKPSRIFGFYQSLKTIGYENLKQQYPASTFRRLVSELEMCGFSRAQICALDKIDNVVVKLPNIINFGSLFEPSPENYQVRDLWQAA